MLELTEDLDLGLHRALEIGIPLEDFDVYLLNSHLLFGRVLEPLEYLPKGTLAQAFASVIGVSADDLQISSLLHSYNMYLVILCYI